MIKEIRGIHVLAAFVLAFGTIIAVNLTLAVNAVRSFPGLEVKNSYVASQSFEADRSAQERLGWDVSAHLEENRLTLSVLAGGRPIVPAIESAVFGRATSVSEDQSLIFTEQGGTLQAPVVAGPGYWNLRLRMRAPDGTRFTRRLPLEITP